MNINTRDMSFVKFNGEIMNFVNYNGVEVYSAGYWVAKAGYPITLTNSLGKNLKNYQIYGNSDQNGTPTPDSRVEIESVGEPSSNLIPFTYTSKTINGVTIDVNNDGSLTYDGAATAAVSFTLFNGTMPLVAGQKYYFSNCSVELNGVEDNYMGQGYTAQEGDYISLIWIWKASGTVFDNVTLKPMVATFSITDDNYEQPGYKILVEVSGINMFDDALQQGMHLYTDGSYTYVTNYVCNSNKIEVAENSTYYIKADSSYDLTYKILYYDKDMTLLSYVQLTTAGQFTTPANAKFINFDMAKSDGTNIAVEDIQDVMVSSTNADYEPYVEPSLTTIYLREPLRKIGSYYDNIDFSNKKVTRYIQEVELAKQTIGLYFYNGLKSIMSTNALAESKTRASGMCNAESQIGSYFDSTGHYMWLGVNNTSIYWVGILDYLNLTTVTEFKEWLKTNPVLIYYSLTTPTEETADLPSITTKKGTNVIVAQTTISPSSIRVVYKSSQKEVGQ